MTAEQCCSIFRSNELLPVRVTPDCKKDLLLQYIVFQFGEGYGRNADCVAGSLRFVYVNSEAPYISEIAALKDKTRLNPPGPSVVIYPLLLPRRKKNAYMLSEGS